MNEGWPDDEPPKTIKAQFDSRCPNCFERIYEGDTLYKDEDIDMWVCEDCGC